MNHTDSRPRSALAERSIEVAARETDVKRLFLEVAPGRVSATNGWLVGHRFGFEGLFLTGGPRKFAVQGAGSTITVDVDRETSTIAMQGGWWYRGEYQITAVRTGSRITHRVYNVAGTGSRWLVPLANRGFAHLNEETSDHVGKLGEAVSVALR